MVAKSCPEHLFWTLQRPDGSRGCEFFGCSWTAPPVSDEPDLEQNAENPLRLQRALLDIASLPLKEIDFSKMVWGDGVLLTPGLSVTDQQERRALEEAIKAAMQRREAEVARMLFSINAPPECRDAPKAAEPDIMATVRDIARGSW